VQGADDVLDRIKTHQDLYNFELGAALSMERKNLKLLDRSAENAQDEQLAQLMRHHQDETRQQIGNIEQAFRTLGWDVDDSPCLPMEAMEKETVAKTKMTDEKLVDAVIASGARETEHHEIAVYENLITQARGMGRGDVADVLQRNLDQERHTLEEVSGMAERMVASMPDRPL
jgi:ferritin-like metal-binding protein YciE